MVGRDCDRCAGGGARSRGAVVFLRREPARHLPGQHAGSRRRHRDDAGHPDRRDRHLRRFGVRGVQRRRWRRGQGGHADRVGGTHRMRRRRRGRRGERCTRRVRRHSLDRRDARGDGGAARRIALDDARCVDRRSAAAVPMARSGPVNVSRRRRPRVRVARGRLRVGDAESRRRPRGLRNRIERAGGAPGEHRHRVRQAVGVYRRRRAHRPRRAAELGSVQPDSKQHRHRARNESHRRRRGRGRLPAAAARSRERCSA